MAASDLYQSDEWKSLHPIGRADLITVIEGVEKGGRKGCIIGGNLETTPLLLRKAGMDFKISTAHLEATPAYYVARAEDLEGLERELDEFRKSPDRNYMDYHVIIGRFLGYPECCIRQYISPSTAGLHGHMSKFYKELAESLADGKSYPPELEYAPAAFTPCGINCPAAIEKLGAWGMIIERNDLEAAIAIKELNFADYNGLF